MVHTKKEKQNTYILDILSDSKKYLSTIFNEREIKKLHENVDFLKQETNIKNIISQWIDIYSQAVKKKYQSKYKFDKKLTTFISKDSLNPRLIWGNCLNVMKGLPSESVHLMVTSPPYYNAREYSHWNNLNDYLEEMRLIIREAYRVLDNHRVFVFNVGDIFDNDNIHTKSTWGKRRIPLGAYFTKIFEEEGFTFVDDFIWDKGEVQSERHKNAGKPYPFYQYPMNCYEHIFVFHKHRNDMTRYPCPVCGHLNVNGNAYSEIGLKSWECKNHNCFQRSAADRGKRFSLKTIMTQSHQTASCVIDKDNIYKWRRDIVKINPVIKINSKGVNKLGHTAPFPIDIPNFAIENFTYPGEIVFDPFGGSFTSVISATKLGRIGVGVELNKKMFRNASILNVKNNLPNINIEEYDYE